MGVSRVQLFSLPVSDQDRAREFYVDVLGFVVVSDTPMGPGKRWLMIAPPGGGTAITLVTWFDSMPPGSTKGTVLEVDDLPAEIARLGSLGVTVSEPEQAPWGAFVTLDDPDGNGIVLQQSA